MSGILRWARLFKGGACVGLAHIQGFILVLVILSLGGVVQAQMDTSWYAGNGKTQSISGLGFEPEIVIIKGDLSQSAVMRTDTMAGDSTKDLAASSSLQSGLITSLDTDGFTVGGDYRVNKGPVPFYTYYDWAAFNAGGYMAETGTYTGDGTSSQTINLSSLSSADYVIVLPAGPEWPVHRSSSMTKSYRFWYCNGTGDAIGAVGGSSFTVGPHAGTGVNLNASGATYHYVGFLLVSGKMNVGSYTGDGTDNRNITGVGFTPEYMILKCDDFSSSVHRTAGVIGDWTLDFMDVAHFQNGIQSLITDGFQVGSDYRVNKNTKSCHWIAFYSTYTAAKVASFNATGLDDQVLVEWKTDTEVDTGGFNVLRAESPEGPWVKLNEHLIPSEGNSWEGGSYAFADQDREPGAVYWYCVEEVDTAGGTERYPTQLVWDEGLEDADGDGMPDAWEKPRGIDTGSEADGRGDADGDGATNLEEYLCGTSPTDARDCPQLLIEGDGERDGVVLRWQGRPGRTYRLEAAGSLAELVGGSATVLSVMPRTSDGPMRFENAPGANDRMRFYRLVVSPPK